MPEPTRIIIPHNCHDKSSLVDSLRYAVGILEQAGSKVQEIVLLTHTQAQLKHTSLANSLGSEMTTALLRGNSVPVSSVTLRHATLRTIGSSAQDSVIVAFYAEDQMLEKVDGLRGIVGVVAVPEFRDQVKQWEERWNPRVPGEQAAVPASLIQDEIVSNALTELSSRINLSNTVFNPRDKEHVNETLRILKANGHSLDAENIKSWAIRNNWRPETARELAQMSKRIDALRSKPSLSKFHNPSGKYQRWCE